MKTPPLNTGAISGCAWFDNNNQPLVKEEEKRRRGREREKETEKIMMMKEKSGENVRLNSFVRDALG